ncbi:MAG: hypothetical protein D6706_03595 [Chloroflexi bacterium]|nr:MAG: hypothetical protein D6706_03595 [Chloroflexota bacterium]
MAFAELFATLSEIMRPYAEHLDCKIDQADILYLDTCYIMKNKKPLFFGSVQIKKNYVSYHLMPIYTNPELLENISPALKKRMQGKSCFNFRKIQPELFDELRQLTQAGFETYRQQGYV